MVPPPITEISFKQKHRRSKSFPAEECTSDDNDEPRLQTQEQELTSPPKPKENTSKRPPIPPPHKSTKVFSKKPRRRVKSLRRNRVAGVMSSRSVISSLTSWTGSRNSLMDDSTASELPTKPQDIFRAKPKPSVFRRKEPPQAATPQRKNAATAPVNDATPVRHNRATTPPTPMTPPPLVASETVSTRVASPSIPLPASYSLSCNESMSTANSASIMGNMTKRAVDNVLDDFLFDDNVSLKSLIDEEEETDSYYGADTKQTEPDLVSNVKEATSRRLVNDGKAERDRDGERNEKESVMIFQSASTDTDTTSVLVRKVSPPEVETVLDDDSYFDRDMEVSSLVEDAMSTLEQEQGTSKDHWHFNVRSVRYRKNDLEASLVDSIERDENMLEMEQEDTAEENDGHSKLEPAWDNSNVATSDSPSLVSQEKNEPWASYSGITSLRSNGNNSIGMQPENKESVAAAESTCSSFATSKPLPTPDQYDDVSLKSNKSKHLVVAVESSSSPWWQDDQDEETGTIANESRKGGKTVKSIDPEDEPFTFRKTFMILFLIIGVAAITGGIAALVTSNHQKSQGAGDAPTAQVASPPRITPPPSPSTTASPSQPSTTTSTTQPVTETIPEVTDQPTAEPSRVGPATSPPTPLVTSAPTASPTTSDTVSPTVDHLKLSLYDKIELFSPESLPALDNATTAQARALNWTLQQPDPSLEQYSLATLFYSSNSKWSNDAGWMTSSSICEWYGVVCSEGKVTEITLSFNNLASTLPEELSLLTDLEVLSLSGAAGTGKVKGSLTGSIPSSWGERMVNLVALELYDNQLSGELPTSLQYLTDLEMLNVDGNKLFGSLPSEIGAMTTLEILDVSSNDFSGSIPTEFGLLTNLLSLRMSDSEFTGFLPTHLGNLKSMKEFHIQNNVLMGSIPKSLYGLSELSWLDLSNNELSGILPPSIGLLSNIEGLLLDDNRIEGGVPVQLSLLTDLRVLTLAKNVLTGSIPNAICDISSLSELTFSEDCRLCPCCKSCLNNNTV